MSEITQILARLESGDSSATEQLFPLVYDELRKLATARLANEKPGQTLQSTALVHDVYLRLIGNQGQDVEQKWDSRGHFFSAAAEAMRRILVENARRKSRKCSGGDQHRVSIDELESRANDPDLILTIDEALSQLAVEDSAAAEIVKLHIFAGLTLEEVAQSLKISRATVYRQWAYARSWLKLALNDFQSSKQKNDT